MRQAILSGALACLMLPAAACKIVPNPDPDAQSEASAAQTDEARMAAYVEDRWQGEVLPVISENTVAYDDLQAGTPSSAALVSPSSAALKGAFALQQTLDAVPPLVAGGKSKVSEPQCPMPNAQCPMPNAQCPMPNAQCPMQSC